MVSEGAEKEIGEFAGEENATAPPNLDIKSVKLSGVDGLFLKAAIETRGPMLPEGDPEIEGIAYRVCLSAKPIGDCTQNAHADAIWTIRGGRFGRHEDHPDEAAAADLAFGPAFPRGEDRRKHALSVQGTLPAGYKPGDWFFVSAAAQAAGPATVEPDRAHRGETHRPEQSRGELSSVKKQDGPFPVIYQAFHYMKPPRAEDLTCTVIKALGDKFDLLAYYSDFRIDNPEAGTSSNGPLGGGPQGGAVTGIGANAGEPRELLHPGQIPMAVHSACVRGRKSNAGVSA